MFGYMSKFNTSVADYKSAKAYLDAMKPWRGETDTYDERPLKHRRARHLGVRIDREGVIRFRLHRTDVVQFYPDGSILLDVFSSLTTDTFANAVLDIDIRCSFTSGFVVVDRLAYRAIDKVLILPDRTVVPTKKWSRYIVDRKRFNRAAKERLPELAEAVAWFNAAYAMDALSADYDPGMFYRRHSLALRMERLKDRANWKCLTPETLAYLREDFTQEYALVETDPVAGIKPREIDRYRNAWRKWGEPR